MKLHILARLSVVALPVACASNALAQVDYPVKPVRIAEAEGIRKAANIPYLDQSN